jgi:hypothetical protein
LSERVIVEIQFDIEQIEHLFASYATLFERALQIRPNLIETTAIASVLHSFYNGLEHIIPLHAIWSQMKAELSQFVDRLSST